MPGLLAGITQTPTALLVSHLISREHATSFDTAILDSVLGSQGASGAALAIKLFTVLTFSIQPGTTSARVSARNKV